MYIKLHLPPPGTPGAGRPVQPGRGQQQRRALARLHPRPHRLLLLLLHGAGHGGLAQGRGGEGGGGSGG